jgi:hypothetical protein
MATLFSGQSLLPGQSLQSDNGLCTLTMQSDGNVVLRDSASTPLWRTGTGGGQFDPRDFIMQTDGNLVLYDTSGQYRWASKTQGNPGAFLNMQNDGNLVVYWAGATTETANNALWNAGTNVPPPLTLKTVVASGETLNVGDADLSSISQGIITSVQAEAGGVIASSPEQGSWSQVGPAGCGGFPLTFNASIKASWNSGHSWTSSQLQQALAGALLAVMKAVGDKTVYQNYSYTEFPTGDTVVCVDPQPSTLGHYIPSEIEITAYDNSGPSKGGQIGKVTATYSTGDQSGGGVCDIIKELGPVLGIFPPASELAAIVGATTAVFCG